MNNFQEIFKALPFPCILLKAIEKRILVKDVNHSFCEFIGRNIDELQGKPFPPIHIETCVQKIEWEQQRKEVKNVFTSGKTEKSRTFRLDQKCPKTNEFITTYWQVENIPLKGQGGEVTYVLNILRDRTSEILHEFEKRKIQEELNETKDRQRHFIDQNPDGLYSLDSEGNFLSLNSGLARIAELPEEKLLTMSFLPFCAPHHLELTINNFKRVLSGENLQFEADFISGSGREVVLNISLNPMVVNGKITGAYGIAKDVTCLRSAEEALEIRDKKYKALVQEGSDLTAILDFEGTYKYVGASSYAVLGISPEEFIGKNAFDFVHPEDKERVVADFEAIKTRKQIRLAPFKYMDSNKEWRWIETTATNLIEDPNVQGVIVNSREVTDLIKGTQEIKQISERYRLAATATEDLIYDWDLEKNKVVRFFKGRQKPFGYSHKEIEKRDFWRNQIHPEEMQKLKGLLKQTLKDPAQTQIRTQYRFRRANGTYAYINDKAHIVRNEEGVPVRVIGATSDISAVVEKENALRVANKRFHYAMRATKEMIWDWDIEENVVKRNESYKTVFGYDIFDSSSIDDWCKNIVKEERKKILNSLDNAIKNKEVKKWEEEYCFLKNNGDKAYVIDRAYILRNKSGKAIRMIGAVLDVSESRRLLKKIKKQNKVLKEVAWEQAHIVRSPLARLKGLLSLLEAESYEEWGREELMDLIVGSANELDEIIMNIIKKTEKIDL